MFFYLKLISLTRSCGLFANGNREMGDKMDKKKWMGVMAAVTPQLAPCSPGED